MVSSKVPRNIEVQEYKRPTAGQAVEVVERKGIGHPDTICDMLMNDVSIELCREYIKKCGTILHHNMDKGLLAAGEADMKFGGGKMTKPMLLIFGDRATFNCKDVEIPVEKITIDTAKKWFKENLRFVDPDKHVRYQSEIKRGSEALMDIFSRGGEMLGANDTSAAVGFAPLSATEKMVLDTEKYLNSQGFKKKFPASGEDIKVMGLRKNGTLTLTIAMAIVDRYIKNEAEYFRLKDEMLEDLRDFVQPQGNIANINLDLNTLDAKGRGTDGLYLTVTGTCADSADCGEVGRGNRVNGIIPLNRPIGTEAAAGKNPVSHVGKIYNVLTHKIAARIYENVDGIEEATVWLLSQIGKPIDHPLIASAQVSLKPGTKFAEVKKPIQEEIDAELADIKRFCNDLAFGKYPVC